MAAKLRRDGGPRGRRPRAAVRPPPPKDTTSYTWTFSRRFFTQVGVLAQQRGITRRELVRVAVAREIEEAVKGGEVEGALFAGRIGEDALDLHQPSRARRA